MNCQTITLEQWREWSKTATRNRTDYPIGAATVARRAADARNSRLVETQRQADMPGDGATCPPEARNAPEALQTAPTPPNDQENAL